MIPSSVTQSRTWVLTSKECIKHLEEKKQQDKEENEKRIHAMTKHMQLLEKMVTERSESDEKKDNDHVKLTRLSDSDDIESYLTTFECISLHFK